MATNVGGVDIPSGAKLLIVLASANHDERHFENPDEIDLYRENTTDHLTFGYGSHQCMGKNIARMEMRIFLEEFTKRLPHLELVADQHYDYLPNTSFRGPSSLWVKWDPTKNPESLAKTEAAPEPLHHRHLIVDIFRKIISKSMTARNDPQRAGIVCHWIKIYGYFVESNRLGP